MDQEFTPEADCPVCSKWLQGDRRSKRELLDQIPLAEPICVRCAVAFYQNIGMLGESAEIEEWLDGTKH